jgi:prevent-host-death family protein
MCPHWQIPNPRYREAPARTIISYKISTNLSLACCRLDIPHNMTNKLVMNKAVTLAEAKAHLSALITEAEEGAEITITRHGRPVARIIGAPRDVARTAGDWGWNGAYDKSVFAPMTDEQAREEGWPV